MVDQNSIEIFSRPPRIQPGHFGSEQQIQLPAPPIEGDESTRSLLLSLLPLASVLFMGGFYLFAGNGGGRSPLFALPMVAMGFVSALTSLLIYSYQKREQRKRKVKTLRDYHRMLDKREARLQAARDLQIESRRRLFPSLQTMLPRLYKRDLRLWEKRANDEDFSVIRLGFGQSASAIPIQPPDPDLQSDEVRRAMDIYFEYQRLPNTPILINLLSVGNLGVVGSRSDILYFMYALIMRVSITHAPPECNFYLFSSRDRHRAWNWLRWLPHASRTGDGGFPDFIAYDTGHVNQLLDELARRIETRRQQETPAGESTTDKGMILAVFDGVSGIKNTIAYKSLLDSRDANLVTFYLGSNLLKIPENYGGIIHVDGDRFRLELVGQEGFKSEGKAERISRSEVELSARSMASIKMPHTGESGRIPTNLDFLQLYGVPSLRQLERVIREKWLEEVPESGVLPLPARIGNDSFSTHLMFHLAENIHGPHGVVAGTTGSGKSELLQTLVCSLALEHHPYLINFLLIDYKGGSTFGIFEKLPHTVGLITNLDKVEALRALEAIKSEKTRREIFLNTKGAEDITEYHERIRGGNIPRHWDPLPHLCIIIDEFAQLKDDLPDFLGELVQTVRVGRSLGMHLILATQRPGGHITDEMRANLQFRICLRVQNPEESREMLRRTDAAYLPTDLPGRAYFQVGNTTTQFQVARVGAKYTQEMEQEVIEGEPMVLNLVRYEMTSNLLLEKDNGTAAAQPRGTGPLSENLGDKKTPLLAEMIVDRMQDIYEDIDYKKAETVLLTSLDPEIPLETVLAKRDYGGWDGEGWQPAGADRSWACAPIGLVDDLANRAQPPLLVDLQERGGNMIIAGGPGTGKTVLLRTLTMSLAHLFTPEEVKIYILSFAGHSLDMLVDLPHVGSVICNEDYERFSRLLYKLSSEVSERRRTLPLVGADDLQQYNTRVLSHEETLDLTPLPAIVVLIDNFAELRASMPNEMQEIIRLMRDGRAAGVHFVLTTPVPSLPAQIMSLVEQRLALRLNDRAEYLQFVGRVGERDVNPRAGSGLLRDEPPLHVQVALPTEGEDDEVRNHNLMTTIRAMKNAWDDDKLSAEPILILDKNVPLDGPDGLLTTAPSRRLSEAITQRLSSIKTPIGLNGLTLQPEILDWLQEGQHYLINGPVATGKSTLLKTLVLGVMNFYSPEEVNFLLVDFGQSMLRSLRNMPHVIDYVIDEQKLGENLRHFQSELRWRQQKFREMQGRDEDLADRMEENSLYPFAPIVIAVDDYDQMRDAIMTHQRLFNELGRMIRLSSHLGFHVLVAGETTNMMGGFGGDGLLKQLKLMRSGFALASAEAVEVLGGRVTTSMRREQLPEGRGYHVTRNSMHLMQFAQSLEGLAIVREIRERWKAYPKADWLHPATEEEIDEQARSILSDAISTADPVNISFDIRGAVEDYKKQQGYIE